MSDSYGTASLPEALVARLKEIDEPGVQVEPEIPTRIKPLAQREILDAAVELVPTLDVALATVVAELTAVRPRVDGVASLDFQTVAFYSSGGAFASIGTFQVAAEFPPFLRLFLENPPSGLGFLVTCRAFSIVRGPVFPGFFRVLGPGVSARFEDTSSGGDPGNSGATAATFTFFVPAGGSGPLLFTIDTEPDQIRLWEFFDCTITQV